MRKVMMVVAVLITSCHVSTSENSQKDGAHTTTSTTHATKNGARLTKPADASAKRSNSFAFCSAMFSPRLTFALPRSRVALRGAAFEVPGTSIMRLAALRGASQVGHRDRRDRLPSLPYRRRHACVGTLRVRAREGREPIVDAGPAFAVWPNADVIVRGVIGIYPSGHSPAWAALAFAALPYLNGRYRWLTLLVPFIVGSGAVYVGAHLPLDGGGGCAMGIGPAFVVHAD